ncbi:MAG: hypothetical protein M1825_003607 [Sarcosagium campestre]|nr:MAG: hypothetical protein M1825_003607 [Sarcosagium campestre]
MDMLSLSSRQDYESLEPDGWCIPSISESSVSDRESVLEKSIKENKKIKQSDNGLDVIIVPGMAFDHNLRRLGHGKGFYDIFFERYSQIYVADRECKSAMPFLVGLALKEQMLPNTEHVPTEDTDWPLDGLVLGDGQILRNTARTQRPRQDP